MQEVDGFTLIDYIKSSIEILMNMKIDEGGEGKGSKNNTMQTLPLLKQLSEKSNLSPGQGGTFEEEKQQTPSSDRSIPWADKEYEKILRQLEAECRNHIKVEQQMKLHIECLQEKIDNFNKEKAKNTLQQTNLQLKQDLENQQKIIKTLEEELTAKADQLKDSQRKYDRLEIDFRNQKDLSQ